jgi:sugar diacid utilization regulator
MPIDLTVHRVRQRAQMLQIHVNALRVRLHLITLRTGSLSAEGDELLMLADTLDHLVADHLRQIEAAHQEDLKVADG